MKKRMLSFLLALLMVVSMLPTHAFAVGENDVAAEATEQITQVCETCGNDPCTCEGDGQEETGNFDSHKGKYAKLNEAVSFYTVGSAAGSGFSYYPEDFTEDTILRIADWKVVGDVLWYLVEFYRGGIVESSFTADFPANPWFCAVDESGVNALVFLDTCTVCGKPDCSGEHNENTCGCCDSCTGAEGCTCECGECDFCEKPEEPTVPSISATVNGQTVTVSGEALPEGIAINIDATVIKTGAVNVTDYDISFSVDGEAYEPEANTKVTITGLDVTAESFVKVIHYLEDIEEIQNGYNAGTIQVWTDATISAQYPAAAAAAYEALGMADTVCVELFYSTEGKIFVGNGSISFNANSFSIYTVTSTGTASGRAYSVYNDDGGAMNSNGYSSAHEVTMDDSNNATYMLTRGQKFYVDIGPTFYEIGMAAYNWKISSGDLGKFDNGKTVHEGGLGNYDEVLTVSSSAPFYTKYTLQVYNKLKTRTINIYVVPEVKLSFNANIPAGATSTNVNVPATQTTVLGDGSTDVRYTRLLVTNPTGSVTGYTFSGWYTAAKGGTKVSSGSYVFLDNDNATYIGGTYNDQYEEVLYAHWDPITYTIEFNANGGTGSMDAQTMTYDQAATLNENQFTSPQTGYVFSGWATSPTGGVVYSDKQSVSNLASTQDDVVNLYAVWTNTMEFTDVRIGLNESYWFTDYNYTVTADGVASSSYHAFPAEPAVQSILYTRETKDDNGNWVISDNAELPGTASLYIDPSIVYSNLFRSSVIATDSTWGVADPTGADTKAFLKFTEADYTAMIKVWLQSMADRTDDTPNADGTYNINYKGTTHITDVNWNEEVNNWEEYEVIPYVIKMEKSGGSSTYNCWRIDMIIAPMRYLTLSYDLNINTAIGYSLTGGSSIPNTQYERDTTQNVLASPHEYNSNIEVSRTVNGVKYTAQFLYWEDEQGNKYGYGTEYNSTVLMDGHKNLKAIWRYPDQTMGSLRVEKDVTVPVNTGLTPNKTQAFTITVKLGTSGSYPYTKYSSTGIVTETSSFTGTTKSFSLKADEYVIITGINQGITYTVSETAPTGYTNKSGTITGTIQAGNTMSATIVNENSSYTESFDFNGGSNTNTSVTVVYGSTNYYDVSWLNPTRTGHKFLGWFTAEEDGTQVYTDEGICIDGAYWSSKKWIGTADLPLYAQWEEEKYTVTFVDDDGTTVLSEAEYEYNTPAASIVKPADPSKAATDEYTYEFTGWTPTLSAVTADATYTATYKATKRSYTITWLDDDGSLIDTTNVEYGKVPTHANPSKAATAEYTYTFKSWSPAVSAVTGNATYTATYTLTKNKYTVTWKNEDGSVLETDTGVEYGTMPSYDGATPTKPDYNQYTYTFKDWGVELEPVTGDVIYIASFDPHENFYTVTWVNYNGAVLETDNSVAWETMPEYNGKQPEKAGNAQFSYTFSGWTPTVSEVRGNVTYTAQFTESVNTYTVTWKDENGKVLETDENVEYGAEPSYDGETPVKAATAEYTYTFAGWDPEVVAVTGNVTYTAIYTETKNKYTITFVDEDGTTILMAAAEYEYGTAAEDIVKPANPTKEATAEFTYSFAGWTPEITDVTKDVVYTATYSNVTNRYTMTGVIDHGTVTGPVAVSYGEKAKLSFTPDMGYEMTGWRISTESGDQIFATPGTSTWDYEISELKHDVTVTVYTRPIQYTISYDLDGGEPAAGVTNPATYTIEDSFTLINPTKEGYTFAGWMGTGLTEATQTVTVAKGSTGARSYTATWTENKATITYKVETTGTGTVKQGESGTAAAEITQQIGVKTGTPDAVSAIPATGYKFIGWYDKDGNKIADTTPWTPTKPDTGMWEDVTYTAKFEINTISLTIKTNTADTNQSYIFTVVGTGLDGTSINLRIALSANDEKTIVGLPAGSYTVANEQGWSWRYAGQNWNNNGNPILETPNDPVAFQFSNIINPYWLNGYGNEQIPNGTTTRKKK